jgi:hypothetical protein
MVTAALVPLPPAVPVKAATVPQVSFVGTATTNISSANRSSATFAHTVPAGNQRLLVVILHMEGIQDVHATTKPTYAGVTMTLAKRQDSASNIRCQVQIWYLVAPTTGANNVVVTYSAAQDWDGITVLSYVGVDQSSPLGATAGATRGTNGTAQTVSITTATANSMVVGGVTVPGSTADPFTPAANCTERADYDTGGGGAAGSDGGCWAGEANRASTGAFTFGATSTGSVRGTVACAEFKPAAEDISNPLSTYDFGTVNEGATASTTLNYFTLTNNSGYAVNITISATDMTGGTAWTLSDTATAGADTYGLMAGTSSFNIIVKKNSPFNTLVSGLSAGSSQAWGLQLLAPTSMSDNVVKTGTVTLTAAAV